MKRETSAPGAARQHRPPAGRSACRGEPDSPATVSERRHQASFRTFSDLAD